MILMATTAQWNTVYFDFLERLPAIFFSILDLVVKKIIFDGCNLIQSKKSKYAAVVPRRPNLLDL